MQFSKLPERGGAFQTAFSFVDQSNLHSMTDDDSTCFSSRGEQSNVHNVVLYLNLEASKSLFQTIILTLKALVLDRQ